MIISFLICNGAAACLPAYYECPAIFWNKCYQKYLSKTDEGLLYFVGISVVGSGSMWTERGGTKISRLVYKLVCKDNVIKL